MAAQSGRTNPSLKDELFSRGYRFDFFQAVRVLARLYPERKAIGRSAAPSDEVVRLRSLLSLAFPPSAVAEIRRDAGAGPVDMHVAFMGLTGPMGVLPRHYTELLLERVHDDGVALRLQSRLQHGALAVQFRARQ
jgi:type VI secretion system protein ImpH